MAKANNHIPVLMYHALEDDEHPAGSNDAGEQLYVLHTDQFREQMEYLFKEGFRTFLLEELTEMETWPEKAVVLTFDDGHESNYSLALPILQEFGFKAEFFITTGWIGTPYFMTEEQIRGLCQAGMGIGSHGVTHSFFSDMDKADAENELLESKQTLVNITNKSIEFFSAPGGRISPDVFQVAVKLGYRLLCSSNPALLRLVKHRWIPRFAITKNTTILTLSNIIQKKTVYLYKLKLKTWLLDITKTILGNNNYQKLRNYLIGVET